jgi:nucleotide-binding universal stress UspA family protein
MFKRILLAVDTSESSDVAISYATSLALSSGATVRVVHVNEYLVGGRGFTVETQGEAISHLESAVFALRRAGVSAAGSLYLTSCFGVDARIVNAANEWAADVIIMGSRRQRRFGRFGGNGLRDRVTAKTALPVLVAPAPLTVSKGHLPVLPDVPLEPLADFPSISI